MASQDQMSSYVAQAMTRRSMGVAEWHGGIMPWSKLGQCGKPNAINLQGWFIPRGRMTIPHIHHYTSIFIYIYIYYNIYIYIIIIYIY